MIPVGVPPFCILLVYVIEEVSSTGIITSVEDTWVIVAFSGAVLEVQPETAQNIRRADTYSTQKRAVLCDTDGSVIFMVITGTFYFF
jgi:hypothetical protein